MEIHFILVEPAVPANVGAAARALNTMGFDSLRLVNPCDHLDEKARWLAHGSGHILEQARVFGSLKEAVADLDLVIGSTAKHRNAKYNLYTAEGAVELVKAKEPVLGKIGIVFGREESGLHNSEMNCCDVLSCIRMKKHYPSLNLGQAVMLYAYIFSSLVLGDIKEMPVNKNKSDYPELKRKVESLLLKLGQKRESRIYSKIMERLAALYYRDIRLLHFICDLLGKKIE